MRARRSGLHGWFIVEGELRIWASACSECNAPFLAEKPTTWDQRIYRAEYGALRKQGVGHSGYDCLCMACAAKQEEYTQREYDEMLKKIELGTWDPGPYGYA